MARPVSIRDSRRRICVIHRRLAGSRADNDASSRFTDDQWIGSRFIAGREGSVGVTAKDNRCCRSVLYRYRTAFPGATCGAVRRFSRRAYAFSRWRRAAVWQRISSSWRLTPTMNTHDRRNDRARASHSAREKKSRRRSEDQRSDAAKAD